LPSERSRATRLRSAAATETERLVAWLRIPAIALIAAGHGIAHPNPNDDAFFAAIVVFAAWSAAVLAYVHLREVTLTFSLVAIAVDVAAITTLAVLSGGAFSQARLAYFLVPIAVAFRFRPSFTAAAATSTVVAYIVQALLHSASSRPEAARFIAVHAGYLLWTGAAAVLLSYVLAARTERVADLAAVRQRLLADALSAEERERQTLAEQLHDHAIQNLLSVGHELQEIGEGSEHPALGRAEETLAETVHELREAMFELHPYVLEQAGLRAAIPAIGRRAARRGGFRLRCDLRYGGPHPQERLLISVARELLANAAKHANATEVTLRLAHEDGEVVLAVRDNGQGFDAQELPERLARGHIGLASQRMRVESAGGRLEIEAAPGRGTTAVVHLPDRPE
jgi:two-component system, NarL family, sensor kinase